SDLERAARSRRVLLEDQRDLLADELLLLSVFLLRCLQPSGEVDQIRDLLWAEVPELQQVLAAQVDDGAHGVAPFIMRRERLNRSRRARAAPARALVPPPIGRSHAVRTGIRIPDGRLHFVAERTNRAGEQLCRRAGVLDLAAVRSRRRVFGMRRRPA